MASNQDIPDEAYEIHNQMVDYLGGQINDDHLCRLKRLFNNIPLTPGDIDKIHDISGLFNSLMEKEKIGIGNYTKIISNLRQINPKLTTYVEEKEIEIKIIINGGPIPAKQARQGDQGQQPSTDPAAMINTTAEPSQANSGSRAKRLRIEGYKLRRRYSSEIHVDLKPMIETTKAKIKNEIEEKKFYPTKGFCDAKEKLQKNKVVVIKGNTGDGKTTIAVQLLHWLSEEQQAGQPLQLQKIKDFRLLAPELKLVTFMDDIFGEKHVLKTNVLEWNSRISDVETLFLNHRNKTNFLIITIRNEVFNSLEKRSLGSIFTKKNIIDLSSQTYKLAEEKKELLELYKPKNFSWTDKEKTQISTYAPNIGFPQCCQLFYNFEELQKERVSFFENPFRFLNEALSRLQECSALLYLFLNDGMIRVKDLDPNSKTVDEKLLEEAFEINLIDGEDDSTKLTKKKRVGFVKENLENLLGVLVVKEDIVWFGENLVMEKESLRIEVVFRFNHESIYVAVALLYGKATLIGYIQNCPRQSLSYLTTSKTATNMIVISSDHYTEMCERLLREFESQKYLYGTCIGSLDVWNDPVFVKRFVGLLNDRKVDKHAVLNKACYFGAEKCALYLLSEGVKPDKFTRLSFFIDRHKNDSNRQVSLLKKIVVYLSDETKVDVLNEACRSDAEECVLYLLSEGVKPDKFTSWWSYIARQWDDRNRQVSLLMKIVVYLSDETKVDTLNKACCSGAEECVLYLLSEGIKPDKDTALSLVSNHWNDGNRQVCLLKSCFVYLNDKTKLDVLNKACSSQAEECALYLLSEGVKPDKDTAFSLVSRYWYDSNRQVFLLSKIVEYLNNETKLDVLNKACSSRAEECALYLLNVGVEPDKKTVIKVVKGWSMNVLRKLLQYAVTHTARDEDNDNVLYMACLFEREDMVTLLCDTYPHLVHDTDMFGRTPLHVVSWGRLVSMFQTVERCVLNSLYRVEDQQHKCETVDGRVVHRNCVCAQYMVQLVNMWGRTVLHVSCERGIREVCLYLSQSYPALTTAVDKDGCHCLHYIARYTIDVDMFTECENHVKQYLESTGRTYDIKTILDNKWESALDKAKERAKEKASRKPEYNCLLDHLNKVFGK